LPEARHCWPSPAAQKVHTSRRCMCALGAVTMWWPRARWRGRRSFVGGLGVACPVGTLRRSDGGCTGQGGAAGFSPETTGGGGAKKMARRSGVPRRRRSSGGRGGCRRVLQLEEGTGELRRSPKGADDRGTTKLTEGGKNGTVVAVPSVEANMRLGKRGGGRRSARADARKGGQEGKDKR
jgi:hypothetical protein